ncbi:hypothetical protein A8F94_04425 [Bacillus sp. FJAT-27225]|uniref:DUF92 domain-containing protein n=1 Tax=Bacillus sp. FJAT-27225 TaxID=1743144 RepID=UPI00080C31D9|nr:DUF92 domain-containing protein [Bacillus sp. FJAT-27225]OCA91111.1 hypothetical protein A8F94_04425 [Bacillus sp. FJAT-27225]
MIGKFISIILIFLASVSGWYLRALTTSGAVAAIVCGLLIFAGTGAEGLILLGVFFVSSSLWSMFKSKSKALLEEKLAKGSRRDWRQVAANGGPATLCSLLFIFTGNDIWVICFASAIASSNSDTWASEIGPLSGKEPFSILTWRRAERGTSGAVSLLGTTAGVAGSAVIAIAAVLFFELEITTGLLIFIFGFLGNVMDTVLGAYAQAMYSCSVCGMETEKRYHCGHRTRKIKGIGFLDNDLVNFMSGILAASGTFIWLITG